MTCVLCLEEVSSASVSVLTCEQMTWCLLPLLLPVLCVQIKRKDLMRDAHKTRCYMEGNVMSNIAGTQKAPHSKDRLMGS